MAEYTLKVQIDPSQLRSQLQAALGKVNMGKMFAGGGGGGSGGFGGAGFTGGQNQKLFEKMNKLLELQVKKAEMAERTQKKGWMGKFGPSIMKIAGITMGLAALRQIGASLIDASPLLQAMAKIGNTAFTLFLRPFGDFLGFLLRPFLILMLKHAIKFYKLFGGINAKELAKRFTDVVTATDPETGEFSPEEFMKLIFGGAITAISFDVMAKYLIDLLFGGAPKLDIPLPMLLGYKRKDEPEYTEEQLEQIKVAQEQARDEATSMCIYPWQDFFKDYTPPTEEEENLDIQELRKMLSGGSTLRDIFNAIMKSEKLTEGFFSSKEIGMNVTEQLLNFLGRTEVELDSATEDMINTSADFGAIAAMAQEALTGGADPAKDEMIKIARRFVTARKAGSSAAGSIEGIAVVFQKANDRIVQLLTKLAQLTVPTSSGEDTKPAPGALEAQEVLTEGEGDIITEPEPPKPPRKTQEQLDHAAIDSIISYNSAFGWDPSKGGTSPYGKIYPDVVKDFKAKYSYRSSEYAHGGIISEPIIGVGMSGRKYSFGEAGAEKVTPISSSDSGSSSGGDNYYATFYVTGVDIDQFETKVKPMVFRWLNELKSNAGIL